MSGDQIASLLYLSLLGAVLAGWFFMQNHVSLNKTLQQAAVWALIFIGAVAVAGLWTDIRGTVTPMQAEFDEDGTIRVPRAADGHYYLTLEINNAPIRFVVDTGATEMVLTQADAERAGIGVDELAYLGRAMTANGEVRTAPVRLGTVSLGAIVDRNLSAWVNQGDMRQSLLGMGYLQRFERLEIARGELVLTR